ncbi:hypothetical protein KKF32_00810 [Patescibacteria group bacterium]|nr:hypothetical protein [Patescibacteria group bacterium]
MSRKNNQNPAAKLLGSAPKLPKTGDHVIDLSKITLPLEQGVAWCFCLGCGTYIEIFQENAKNFCVQAGNECPTSWSNHYFTVSGCVMCGEDFEGVKLVLMTVH